MLGPLTREELENIAKNLDLENSDIDKNLLSEGEYFIEYKTEIIGDETELIDLHSPMKEINNDDWGNNSTDNDEHLNNLVLGSKKQMIFRMF